MTDHTRTGAQYIAEFLARMQMDRVYLMTGGACAFMVDAIAENPATSYVCVQNEQAAAMAADAVWRTTRTVGVAMATSGPGATNLLTGIACSYFDSIPALHITGQVHMRESDSYDSVGAKPRQAGFQETKIADMARPITKYAIQVKSAEALKRELAKAYEIATSGRMGPVLIDVPLDVQMGPCPGDIVLPARQAPAPCDVDAMAKKVTDFLKSGERPLVLFGAGVGLAGVEDATAEWLEQSALPFVTSWNGATYFDHDLPNYQGKIGVYGNRGANYMLQNCDRLLVLGSRLDNRQRSGNASTFVPGAEVLVLDTDVEELNKYKVDGYATAHLHFAHLPAVLGKVAVPALTNTWGHYVAEMRDKYFADDIDTFAHDHGTLSPYAAMRKINGLIDDDAVVIADTGAALCWIFQTFHRKNHDLFTAGGNSPMGYSLCAAIGAKFEAPDRQVVALSGDGGFQVNLQELQTIAHYKLDVPIVIFNNAGYGIIKQYQDSYMDSRYAASGAGYSQPDFAKVADAYAMPYHRIETLDDISQDLFAPGGPRLIEVVVHENTLIEPKLEVGRPINDQFPYASDEEFASGNRFVSFERIQD